MKYARLSAENTVLEVFIPPAAFPIEQCFTPDVLALFEACPEEVEPYWVRQDDGTYLPPPPPDAPPAPTGD